MLLYLPEFISQVGLDLWFPTSSRDPNWGPGVDVVCFFEMGSQWDSVYYTFKKKISVFFILICNCLYYKFWSNFSMFIFFSWVIVHVPLLVKMYE